MRSPGKTKGCGAELIFLLSRTSAPRMVLSETGQEACLLGGSGPYQVDSSYTSTVDGQSTIWLILLEPGKPQVRGWHR